jgi:hypothetical protein
VDNKMDGSSQELYSNEIGTSMVVNKAISSNHESSSGTISSSEAGGRLDKPSGPQNLVAGTW